MEIIGPLLMSLGAGLSTVVGSLFVFLKPKNHNNFIGFSLAFSASIMLLISVFELIPEGYIYIQYKYSFLMAFLAVVLALFAGNLISNTLNKKISKIKGYGGSLYRVGLLSMIALMIHNLPEGILTFLSSLIDIELGAKLTLAIIMHNIPEGIAIAVPIYYATGSKFKAIKNTLISGLAEPLGAVIAWVFLAKHINGLLISIILLFVAGLMTAISINEIFLEANKHSRKSIVLGIGIAICIFICNLFFF